MTLYLRIILCCFKMLLEDRCIRLRTQSARLSSFSWPERLLLHKSHLVSDRQNNSDFHCPIGSIQHLQVSLTVIDEGCKNKGNLSDISLKRGPLTRYVKLRVVHAPWMPGTFSPQRLQRKPLVSDLMRAVMYVGIANLRCMCNPQFYIYGKRPMVLTKSQSPITPLYIVESLLLCTDLGVWLGKMWKWPVVW